MKSTFSEFSYGFAITNEMVGLTALNVAPVFPSLIEEGKKGNGYDVKLDAPGVPLYLQFKRSDFMKRDNAREKQITLANKQALSVPFHRFPITPNYESTQHESLVELDSQPNSVFYVAPRFHLVSQLNQAWANKKVATESVFVRPRDIGAIQDNDTHAVAFDELNIWLCSEPKPLKAFGIEDIAELLRTAIAKDSRPVGDQVDEWAETVNRAKREAARKSDERLMLHLDGDGSSGLVPTVVGSASDAQEGAPSAVQRDIVQIRDAKKLPRENSLLAKISDAARMDFEAQFFVVQQRS